MSRPNALHVKKKISSFQIHGPDNLYIRAFFS